MHKKTFLDHLADQAGYQLKRTGTHNQARRAYLQSLQISARLKKIERMAQQTIDEHNRQQFSRY